MKRVKKKKKAEKKKKKKKKEWRDQSQMKEKIRYKLYLRYMM